MKKHNYSSVCRFPSKENQAGGIEIVNFVYEPYPASFSAPETRDYYSMYVVLSGKCAFFTDYKHADLSRGDVVFTLPKKRFRFASNEKLKLLYLSFTGYGAQDLLKRMQVSYVSPVRHAENGLLALLRKEFSFAEKAGTVDLSAMSMLLLFCSRFTASASAENEGRPPKIGTNPALKSEARRLTELIHRHYAEDDFSLKKAAEYFHYNPNYLSQLYKTATGAAFSAQLREIRLRKSAELLTSTELTVAAVAEKTGFSDAKYFERVFHKEKGLTPTVFRRETRKKEGAY